MHSVCVANRKRSQHWDRRFRYTYFVPPRIWNASGRTLFSLLKCLPGILLRPEETHYKNRQKCVTSSKETDNRGSRVKVKNRRAALYFQFRFASERLNCVSTPATSPPVHRGARDIHDRSRVDRVGRKRAALTSC